MSFLRSGNRYKNNFLRSGDKVRWVAVQVGVLRTAVLEVCSVSRPGVSAACCSRFLACLTPYQSSVSSILTHRSVRVSGVEARKQMMLQTQLVRSRSCLFCSVSPAFFVGLRLVLRVTGGVFPEPWSCQRCLPSFFILGFCPCSFRVFLYVGAAPSVLL